ncbi:protein NEDD1 [Physcomitrium patens]|uniref:Uncharacterized protein n=1 Tax=Physcomitrium patens TaxID=3218 RepID=A0A2K1JKT7_PHYPA|nr:protein NEDD1-like [Physcomitrium patens]XP_024392844.1 protein NEDD1-like [Physcomitrium patens]PNR42168.1 hypothetical protein PHYPA_016997 [Physcomitrium patens]|eukprot:XP_024392843.1 protein NEDD1-like [Physcomitrella patens]
MAQGTSLLAACGGETVKLFDVSIETGDPCTFQYTPSPGYQVNCVRWNHTNLVVASAGEDCKISLWMKNGQTVGVVPQPGEGTDDNIDESILGICFSSKGSRYLGSGGTGKIVRIWDLQRRRCIKWLKGHTDTITGVMYNCRDEHLASISIKGDLIVHSLASGTRAAELKDPHNQVLRVMEYSRLSRHLLLTAGDDGTVHVWDTTSRSPKVSWLKQHSAPTTGLCFSPTSDKMIVSAGLDKKLYTYDPGVKKPVFCVPYEAPFASLAFRDDGNTLAAGTNSGRVVFYDLRGRPQPFTILRAYGASEAVTSLSWQRSNPISVKDTRSGESALLGNSNEESVLMPDPLPAGTRGRTTSAAPPTKSSIRISSFSGQVPSSAPGGPSGNSRPKSAGGDVTPYSSMRAWGNNPISRLQTPWMNAFNSGNDDMEVFSPLVDVQPITPSVTGYWDEGGAGDGFNKDMASLGGDKRTTWGTSSVRRFPNIKDVKEDVRESRDSRDSSVSRRPSLGTRQDDLMSVTPPPGISSGLDRSPSTTPPEAWGGEPLERGGPRQSTMSRFASTTELPSSRFDSLATPADYRLPASTKGDVPLLRSLDQDSSLPLTHGVGHQSATVPASDFEAATLAANRKLLSYEARDLNSSFSRSLPGSLPGSAGYSVSPKQRKSALDRREGKGGVSGSSDGKKDSENDALRSDAAGSTGATSPVSNGHAYESARRAQISHEQHQQQQRVGATGFALQLVQRGLEESLGAVQRAIHEEVKNLHLELLRQFHIQQMEMGKMMNSFLAKQAELNEEIKALRRENQHLRDLY